MSALYHFNEILPTTEKGVISNTDKRQVEIYDLDQNLFLRIGTINTENIHDAPYEVLLTREMAENIILALKSGIQRSGPK